jgi:acyl-CoA synthetase (AMP-forming)/AMP-acid ligase II
VVGPSPGQVPTKPPIGYELVDHAALGHHWVRREVPEWRPHPDLGVMLATSGSTGNPRFVRLSRAGVLANTASIIEALGIDHTDVSISSLPSYYSYGMSVLNTHLSAGATFVVEAGGVIQRPFWDAVSAHQVTSLSCVPYQYEILRRIRFDPAAHPSLRTLTQAGGRMGPERLRDVHALIHSVGGRLFVMYGQTEAGPRMTTLPAEAFSRKSGSVGPAIPGGRVTIRPDDGDETIKPGVRGEVIYRGPNVMMGYAETVSDLALGDVNQGVLETGDIGHLDEDGYLYIDGRIKRIGKVFGIRVNLDDVEAMVTGSHPVAVVNNDDRIIVWIEGADEESLPGRAAALSDRLKVHHSGISVRTIDALPLLRNGKIDLRALEGHDG